MNNLSTKRLLLLDGIGAALSLVMLVMIKLVYNGYTSIDEQVLTACIGIAALLLLFDCIAYGRFPTLKMLKVVAVLNILYTLFTISYMCVDWNEIRNFGRYYLLAEVVVLVILIYIEVRHIKTNSAAL